jgi:hypothetical protein
MFTARSLASVASYSSASVARQMSSASKKVAVLGAAGGIGQPLSMLLKLSPAIGELACYDIVGTPGVAADLSHVRFVCLVAPASRLTRRVNGASFWDSLGMWLHDPLAATSPLLSLYFALGSFHSSPSFLSSFLSILDPDQGQSVRLSSRRWGLASPRQRGTR